jgi:hypothetical protein
MDIVRAPGTAGTRGGELKEMGVLVAEALEDEMHERLGVAGGLERSVAREV